MDSKYSGTPGEPVNVSLGTYIYIAFAENPSNTPEPAEVISEHDFSPVEIDGFAICK
jgi:hypothetical protein